MHIKQDNTILELVIRQIDETGSYIREITPEEVDLFVQEYFTKYTLNLKNELVSEWELPNPN